MKTAKRLRCAIYTRKSTQEGLTQDFNSLDAQRESCDAYITSQIHEGWSLVPGRYDDGGFSGGSMERPALKTLITDIERGRIDIVVVYKVDRLTRSLTDFAKLVEVFDQRSVSFVSVTQAFNTTTSMGRLTLNVLLSFAQFEREVTAERIRDKFKASKEKGMWMGGRPPLGLDVRDRQLIINSAEAKQVRHIFARYLELKSVMVLKKELEHQGLHSKRWKTQKGIMQGGNPFTRGALYSLMQNPVYIGKIRHKDLIHEGQHKRIVPQDHWDRVQEQLAANRVTRATRSNAKSSSLLAGLLVDSDGHRLSPRHSKSNGRRHRYYVSPTMTLPAHEIERVVIGEITTLLTDAGRLVQVLCDIQPNEIESRLAAARDYVAKLKTHPCPAMLKQLIACIIVQPEVVEIDISIEGLMAALCGTTSLSVSHDRQNAPSTYRITRAMQIKRCGHGKMVILSQSTDAEPAKADPSLLKALARAHSWFDDLKAGLSYKQIAKRDGIDQRHVARTIRLAFLAPDIAEAILKGCEPHDLTTERLLKLSRLPGDWQDQRELLGFI